MARIVGVNIPDDKKIAYALSYIRGIGLARARKVLAAARVDEEKRTKELDDQELARISSFIERNYKIEGELYREVQDNIKRLMDIGTYRGIRHKKGLPVRGQRTRHNARTRKGHKKLAVGGLTTKKKRAKAKT